MCKLTKKRIQELDLIQKPDQKSFKGASYDVALGRKVYDSEGERELKPGEPLKIPPHEFVTVSCSESFKLPDNVVGRIDLRREIFFKGLILQPGLQLDPGFEGELACFLFNVSSETVTLTPGQTFLSVEFSLTSEAVPQIDLHESHGRPWNFHKSLVPGMATESGIAKVAHDAKAFHEEAQEKIRSGQEAVQKELSRIRDGVRDVHRRTDATAGVLLTLAAFLVAVVAFTAGPREVGQVLREGVNPLPIVGVLAGAFLLTLLILGAGIYWMMSHLWRPYSEFTEQVEEAERKIESLRQQIEAYEKRISPGG